MKWRRDKSGVGRIIRNRIVISDDDKSRLGIIRTGGGRRRGRLRRSRRRDLEEEGECEEVGEGEGREVLFSSACFVGDRCGSGSGVLGI